MISGKNEKNSFCEALKQCRIQLGYTIRQAAKITKVNHANITRWEHGETRPAMRNLRRYLVGLRIPDRRITEVETLLTTNQPPVGQTSYAGGHPVKVDDVPFVHDTPVFRRRSSRIRSTAGTVIMRHGEEAEALYQLERAGLIRIFYVLDRQNADSARNREDGTGGVTLSYGY